MTRSITPSFTGCLAAVMVAALSLLFATQQCDAANFVANDQWSTPAAWDTNPTIPTDFANIGFGRTAGIDDGYAASLSGSIVAGIGGQGNGTLNLSNGSLAVGGDFILGFNTSTGSFNQTGGVLTVSGVRTLIGRFDSSAGTGIYVISNGTSNIGAGDLEIGSGSGATGTMTVSGSGIVNVAAGAPVRLAVNGGTGTLNLDGGTFSTARDIVNFNSGTSTLNFNGGILQVAAGYASGGGGLVNGTSSGTNQPVTAVVKAGGAIIDTNGLNATISAALTDGGGGGGLTKNSGGTLTLTAANAYTGSTTINAGALALASTSTINSSSSIKIGAGAIFDVSAIASYAMAGGQPFTFDIDPFSGGSAGLLDATGTTLNITSGNVVFNLLGTLDDPFYVLANYGSLSPASGPFSSATAPAGYTIDYSFGGNQIALVAIPTPAALPAGLALLGLAAMRRRS